MGFGAVKQEAQNLEADSSLSNPSFKLAGHRQSVNHIQKRMLKTARPLTGTLREQKNTLKPNLRRPRPASPRWPVLQYSLLRALLRACRCCKRSRRLRWNQSVRVNSFSRRLGGGDAVPSDGTVVALGLGGLVEQTWAPLANSGVQSDQISWMSTEQRQLVLMAAMGSRYFAGAQAQRGPELQRLLDLRQHSKQDGKDMSFMPTSWKEARERAEQLSAEVTAERVEQCRADAMRRLSCSPSPRRRPYNSIVKERPRSGALLAKGRRARKAKLPVKISPLSSVKCRRHPFKSWSMMFRPDKPTRATPQMS